ncbi:hypothetical protein V498_06791 [Pseudogymnoascus sp. VKM F-4517 (FW-2822)]|nr:hypothetical protein V498_06791 [Pseudogymnoascus sp. VKM F-4517 (FW-2822)]
MSRRAKGILPCDKTRDGGEWDPEGHMSKSRWWIGIQFVDAGIDETRATDGRGATKKYPTTPCDGNAEKGQTIYTTKGASGSQVIPRSGRKVDADVGWTKGSTRDNRSALRQQQQNGSNSPSLTNPRAKHLHAPPW